MPLLILPPRRKKSKQKLDFREIEVSAVDIRANARLRHCGKYPHCAFCKARSWTSCLDLPLFATHQIWHACCASRDESVTSVVNCLRN